MPHDATRTAFLALLEELFGDPNPDFRAHARMLKAKASKLEREITEGLPYDADKAFLVREVTRTSLEARWQILHLAEGAYHEWDSLCAEAKSEMISALATYNEGCDKLRYMTSRN
jgi:hypothetical protein